MYRFSYWWTIFFTGSFHNVFINIGLFYIFVCLGRNDHPINLHNLILFFFKEMLSYYMKCFASYLLLVYLQLNNKKQSEHRLSELIP